MHYDYYLSTADKKRKNSAITGLESGSLAVEDLRNDTDLTAIVRNGDHGYQVSVTRQGIDCGCKDHEFHGRKYGTSCKHLIAAMLVDQMQNEVQQAA